MLSGNLTLNTWGAVRWQSFPGIRALVWLLHSLGNLTCCAHLLQASGSILAVNSTEICTQNRAVNQKVCRIVFSPPLGCSSARRVLAMVKCTDLSLLLSCRYNASGFIHLPKGQGAASHQGAPGRGTPEAEVGRTALSDPLVINYLVKAEAPAQPGRILSDEKRRQVWRKENSRWCSARGVNGDADGPARAGLQKGDRRSVDLSSILSPFHSPP